MCTCHNDMNAKLAPLNGKLATGFVIERCEGAPIGTRHMPVLIQVEKITPRGKRPPVVLATFCPFCGDAISQDKRGSA